MAQVDRTRSYFHRKGRQNKIPNGALLHQQRVETFIAPIGQDFATHQRAGKTRIAAAALVSRSERCTDQWRGGI
jgi:hypothetical protein